MNKSIVSKVKGIVLLIISISYFSCSDQTQKTVPVQDKRPVDYVDPFISTQGDHGHWHPSALVPFGLVKLGPDTYPGSLTADGDYAHSGYDYSDDQIRGFSHFHKGSSGGTSVGDRAGLLSIMPFIGKPKEDFWKDPIVDIDKKTETAKPGYYSVFLSNDHIKAELTSSAHVGVHRYTFPKDSNARMFLQEGNRHRSIGLTCKLIDDHTVEGVEHTTWGTLYFTMHFNFPVSKTEIWDSKSILPGSKLDNKHNGGLICDFGNIGGAPLEIKTGVSLTGVAAARANLKDECPDGSFDAVRDEALAKWSDKLDNIEVKGSDEYKTIFYTALYHTCFLPVTITDDDGTYPGLDRKNHKADGYVHYDDYAFWDSFRTKYPLYSLFQPAIYRDVVKSIRDIYTQADNWDPYPNIKHTPHNEPSFLARGKNGYQVFDVCRQEHMLMVVTDAFYKGLCDFDMNEVYPYMKKEALLQMPKRYDKIGYIPKRADQTGEYSWDNWCLAQVAKTLGHDDDYKYFMKRSTYWKNTWDPSLKFFRARSTDGSWLDFPEDPTINREKYTYEGTLWQWRWNVLHDVPSLIKVFGGRDNFIKELSYFFDNDLYTAGNQPDLQAPFLFNIGGAPWLTQKWVRKILTEPIVQRYGTHELLPEPVFDRVYKATPDGYLEEMDDDYGCMSAWYVMSSMGLYQVCPGDPVYQITAPIFKEVKIKLDSNIYSGKQFVIKANNLDSQNIYIQSATLDGNPLDRSWISHDEIVKGGTLVFEMGPEPNKQWGTVSTEKE